MIQKSVINCHLGKIKAKKFFSLHLFALSFVRQIRDSRHSLFETCDSFRKGVITKRKRLLHLITEHVWPIKGGMSPACVPTRIEHCTHAHHDTDAHTTSHGDAMFTSYKHKIKDKTIRYVDSYIPLGYTLGDLSPHLQKQNSDSEPMETITVRESPTPPSVSSEDMCNRITTMVMNQRRNDASKHRYGGTNSAPSNMTEAAGWEMNSDYYSSPPPSSRSAAAAAAAATTSIGSTIEFVIPPSSSSSASTHNLQTASLVDTDIDMDRFSSGLSLLNMSLNSEIVSRNPQNMHKFLGQSLAEIVNSIKDRNTLQTTFSCLEDDLKVHLLRQYLSDEKVVSDLKKSTKSGTNETNFARPPSYSIPAISHLHRQEASLQTLLLTLLQASIALTKIIFRQFGIPVINFIWTFILTLNEKYNIVDILLTGAVKILSFFVTIALRLILHCTSLLEPTSATQKSPMLVASSSKISPSLVAKNVVIALMSRGFDGGNIVDDAVIARGEKNQ